MSSTIFKPPWKNIQWYPFIRITAEDISGCPIIGDWQEENDLQIEALKESIQPFDKTELWDLAKRITNPYELISSHSTRLQLPKSISCIYLLSRSYFKMIEILNVLQFFDRHKEVKLRSLHICEGPGGFIEGFHSMAEDKKRIIQSSYAMTLRSTHNMIPGWRRATAFLQKHPSVQIIYGPTRTGNIYEPCNQDECVTSCGQNGAHLVTSDGGFDFSDDFHAQEKSIIRLLISSSLILLRSVAVDGDIVLKFFDSNSPMTRDIITLLGTCFQEWTIYKPATSRPCNSEWYFLGKSAKRTKLYAVQLFTQIRDGLAQEPPVSYQRILLINPIDSLLKGLQAERCSRQMEALKQVLSFCHNKDTVSKDALWALQKPYCIDWCHYFRVATEYR